VFDGLFHTNIPCLSHNGMENARTTIKLVTMQHGYSRCSFWYTRFMVTERSKLLYEERHEVFAEFYLGGRLAKECLEQAWMGR